MASEELLRCDDLEIGYDTSLVGGIALRVKTGGLTIIFGPNGSGKTTLLRTLFGLVPPRGGSFRWQLPEAPLVRPDCLMRAGVRFMGQGPRGFGALSVRDQQDVLPRLYGFPAHSSDTSSANRKIAALSYGQRRLAALTTLRAGHPRCYLLDEPLAGLDRKVEAEVVAWMRHQLSADTGMLVVEHRVGRLLPYIDQIMILRGRQVAYCGPPEQVPSEFERSFSPQGGEYGGLNAIG